MGFTLAFLFRVYAVASSTNFKGLGLIQLGIEIEANVSVRYFMILSVKLESLIMSTTTLYL